MNNLNFSLDIQTGGNCPSAGRIGFSTWLNKLGTNVMSNNAIQGVTSLGTKSSIRLNASKMIAPFRVENSGMASGVNPAK